MCLLRPVILSKAKQQSLDQDNQVSSDHFNRKLDGQITDLMREIEILYSKVLRGQLRWFEALSFLAKDKNPTAYREYGYYGPRGENSVKKLGAIARHMLSPPPTITPDTQFFSGRPIDPEGFRGKIANLATRRLMTKAKTLEDVQWRTLGLKAEVSLVPCISSTAYISLSLLTGFSYR